MPRRHLTRRHLRDLRRRSARGTVRQRWRSPDYLAQTLVAFNRLLHCNHRLAKLAPEFFDPVVVDRTAREREERRRWRAEWEPALNKVYGPPSTLEPDLDELPPPLPAPRVQRRIDELLAERALWLATGRLALRRYRERRAHAVASLSQIARLVWTATQLGRWAAGIPDEPEPPAPPRSDPWADLARAYPELETAPAAMPDSSVAEVAPVDAPAPSRDSSPVPAIMEPTPRPDTVHVARRDAWSSWARQLRRNAGLR